MWGSTKGETMTCARCYHPKENHDSGICSGSLTCMCPRYEEQFLNEFAQLVEKIKYEQTSINQRCKFILEKIPPLRNATEKQFAKAYKEIWYGFKIRKEGTKLTIEEWKRMPHDDDINRQKRKVKQDHPELSTYEKKVIEGQAAKFLAMWEMAIES